MPLTQSSPSSTPPPVLSSSNDSLPQLFTSARSSPPLQPRTSGGHSGLSSQTRISRSNSNSGSIRLPSSRQSSLRHVIFPPGDSRNDDADAVNEVRSDMMVKWLYEQQLRKRYVSGDSAAEGVVLKKAPGWFTCWPPQMAALSCSLQAAVAQMNVCCAMTVNTPVVRAIINSLSRKVMNYLPLSDGRRVQILESMADLPKGGLHHFAAFIMDARVLVVWDDDPDKLLQRAHNLEARLVEIIWGSGKNFEDEGLRSEKTPSYEVEETDLTQLESGVPEGKRTIRLENAFLVGCTMTLCIVCLGLGLRSLIIEALVDGNWTRLFLMGLSPFYWFISLFFFQTLVGNVYRIFGPTAAIKSNSKYYSGRPPRRLNRKHHPLPHVTFQMPIYKEGLSAVIKPTVVSLKAAISTYEMQGGTANIFVNDDGMQLIPDQDAQLRRDFYDEHNIGWVARPAHRPTPNLGAGEKAFLRRGRFKKASNMNYALHISNRVEEKLATISRSAVWTQDDETGTYYQCLSGVLQEDEGRTWAEGGIRIGDYILLVDSDTRVPPDCLLDAVSEMEQSPELALIQFSSGVMNVTSSFFEKGLTWFTHLIYSAITFAVASGDSCPFVGHNAMLRWSAIQDAAAHTDVDGYEKYWSESHVSEDFDMALRLQVAGYVMRYASYSGDGFKEGVSLTVFDELARWEKYAYGCNELLFHPLRLWLTKGPLTPLFKRFLLSCIPLPSKLTILAYIGTYYAIAAAWAILLVNYFITGWYWGYFDKYYVDSFAIYISIVVVFTGLGNLTLAVLRFRLGQSSLLASLFENIKWIPMFTIFMGGISIHVAQAILSHFFEIEIAWGATAKEIEEVNFGQETIRILRRFKYTFLLCFACTAMILAGYFAFPTSWRIDTFASIFPLAMVVGSHFALPVLLNPALMMFTW
ncbi:hypothetical protein GQ53DRAFT_645221 [Thozetella sp. PMI_491]|nr:hypothetical protein GQ53DRAFT_645221 [Thozetella sp. PMI_491]